MLRQAFDYRRLGIPVFPLRPRSKEPAVPWQQFTLRLPSDEELHTWFADDRNPMPNIAGVMGVLSALVAVDADDQAVARQLKKALPPTPMMTLTPRGAHFLFRIRPGQILRPRVHATILGVPADIRGDGSYVALADSIHPSGITYKRAGSWDREEVPFFDESWISDLTQAPPGRGIRRGTIQHVAGYLARVESIQGNNGSAGLVRACAICRDAGLSQAEATIELLKWNQLPVVAPPWPERDIARAVTRVYANQT
jgi:hypothetical protein